MKYRFCLVGLLNLLAISCAWGTTYTYTGGSAEYHMSQREGNIYYQADGTPTRGGWGHPGCIYIPFASQTHYANEDHILATFDDVTGIFTLEILFTEFDRVPETASGQMHDYVPVGPIPVVFNTMVALRITKPIYENGFFNPDTALVDSARVDGPSRLENLEFLSPTTGEVVYRDTTGGGFGAFSIHGFSITGQDEINLPVGMASGYGGESSLTVNFTGVKVTEVPEPTTAVLLLVGIGFGAHRRFKSSRSLP